MDIKRILENLEAEKADLLMKLEEIEAQKKNAVRQATEATASYNNSKSIAVKKIQIWKEIL